MWKPVRGRGCRDSRQARFQTVLRAALNTRLYGPVLRAAGLGTPERIAGLASIEEALALIPPTEVGGVSLNSSVAAVRPIPGLPPRGLFWPLPRAGRTAVLLPGFPRAWKVKPFNPRETLRLAEWRPEAVAGPVSELQRLADQIEDQWGRMPALSHSVLAFVTLRQAFLSDQTRDRFWRVFKVPVFGQIFGLSGELLAWECEAHEGYHIAEQRAVIEVDQRRGQPELLVTSLAGLLRPAIRLATGLEGRIEHSACGCGRRGPRLVDVRLKTPARIAVAAASAA